MSTRMTAIDAQFYWMSAKVPTDMIMLYAFDGVPTDVERAIQQICTRANDCRALAIRVEEGSPLTYPRWVPTTVEPDRIVRHDDDTWDGCVSAVTGLSDDQVDAREAPWRMHLFAPVRDIPGSTAPGTVAIMQFAHALSDGMRAMEMAAWLFGRETPVPDVPKEGLSFLPWSGIEAARAHRRQVRDTQAGLLPPAIGPQPALPRTIRPTGAHRVRTLQRHRSELGDATATVAALAAVSGALAHQLGDTTQSLTAEVTMTKPGARHGHNHFANVTVGLYPSLSREARRQCIARDLSNARRRSEHPAVRAADHAFAATPAPLLRWGIGLFDPEAQPSQVAGNTVVSSLFRVATDLAFGDAPVLLNAVYPELSPAMSLVHGVWGTGDVVTISVHAAESAVSDIDDYVDRLHADL